MNKQMLVVGQLILERFAQKHKDAQRPLANWLAIAEAAEWRSLADVRKSYPSADGVKLRSGTVVTVFNIGGNKYRLLSVISYDRLAVEVADVLTHAEYNKEKWKRTM